MSYRLKVILDTSIPFDKKQEVMLTSSLLEYNPKRKLPLEEYPWFSPNVTYSKNEIMKMPYYKRIELFFNTQKFKKNILALWNGIKDTNVEQQTRREINNVDVFISAILPTSYPVANNYEKSYDFFDSGNNIFSSILSSFSKSEFSHLKINQKMYTVVGVILRNDVFNHPFYSSFLQELANVEQHAVVDEDKGGFQTFYDDHVKKNTKLWGSFTTATKPTRTPYKDEFEIFQIFDTSIKINDLLGTNPPDTVSQDNIEKFQNWFNYLNEHSSSIGGLDKANVSFSDINKLKLIVNEFGKLWIKKRALEYITSKKFDFSSEGKREKEIREYIEKINPSFRKFSDMILDLQKNRLIENKSMKEIIKKKDIKELTQLIKCRTDQSKCAECLDKNLIYVGLDRIKSKESAFTTIEICLMVNLIEGNINSENYKKIKCSYLDKSLGSLFENFMNPLNTWDITDRKMFFSIQNEISQIEATKDSQKDKKKGKTLNKKAITPKTKTRRAK
jgi:hypothetical protein